MNAHQAAYWKNSVHLSDAVRDMEDGDLLLWRQHSRLGRLIAAPGRSIYSHAAMFAWWDNRPMVLEVREFYGGRIRPLVAEVNLAPGQIDHFRIVAPLLPGARQQMVDRMCRYAGGTYNYAGVLTVGLTRTRLGQYLMSRLPIERRWDLVDEPPGPHYRASWMAFCSEAYASAYRKASDRDPLKNLSDAFTEPGHLCMSPEFEGVCSLVP